MQVIESIEKERDKAIKATGYTITKALTKLTEIVDNTEEPMPVIHAIRTANAMLPGYAAPQDIQIKQRTLIMELNSLSHSDIVNLTDALKSESDG
jgi:hypothetical protein